MTSYPAKRGNFPPTHPGELLREDVIPATGRSKADIARLLGISRQYAIPLLEYFDTRRVTARVGERRVLRGG